LVHRLTRFSRSFVILSWEWLPFSLLILLTAMQSLDQEQLEAARMDGAGAMARFAWITLPHLCAGGRRCHDDGNDLSPCRVRRDLRYHCRAAPEWQPPIWLISSMAARCFSSTSGAQSAGGVIAIILANMVAALLARSRCTAAGGMTNDAAHPFLSRTSYRPPRVDCRPYDVFPDSHGQSSPPSRPRVARSTRTDCCVFSRLFASYTEVFARAPVL
jgi:hypothetical protein